MSVQAITWALEQRVGSTTGKAILMCLANYADKDGRCFPGQATIAWECEVSKRTVVEWMQQLEKSGFIRRERRNRSDGSRTSDWVFLSLPWASTTTSSGQGAKSAPSENQPDQGADGASLSADDRTSKVQDLHTMNRKGNQEEQNQESPPNPPAFAGGESDELDFEGFWNAWSEQQRNLSRAKAFNRFQRMVRRHPEIRGEITEAVKRYREASFGKSKPAKMSQFLRGEGYLEFIGNPPAIDKDGFFVIKPGSPEWSVWLGDIRNKMGEGGVQSALRIGKIVRQKRWPEGYPQQEVAA